MVKSLLVLIITLSFSFVYSQQEYTWADYNLSFTLADDFVEATSTPEEFSAIGDGMEMSIIPFNDGSIDKNDIVGYTMSIAASLELSRMDEISTININGFTGGYAEGEQDGERLFIMGLIDPDSDSNFFVIISFQDDDENASKEAINICKSIKKY